MLTFATSNNNLRYQIPSLLLKQQTQNIDNRPVFADDEGEFRVYYESGVGWCLQESSNGEIAIAKGAARLPPADGWECVLVGFESSMIKVFRHQFEALEQEYSLSTEIECPADGVGLGAYMKIARGPAPPVHPPPPLPPLSSRVSSTHPPSCSMRTGRSIATGRLPTPGPDQTNSDSRKANDA